MQIHKLEDLFQETINKTTENMATIDHYHGDEMKHVASVCAASHVLSINLDCFMFLCRNAYSMFCAKILKQANSNMSPKERMAECTIQWNKLTTAKKEAYKTDAARVSSFFCLRVVGFN